MIRSLDEYVIPHPLTICVVEAKPEHTMIPLVCLHGFLVHWMKSLFLTYWQSVLSKRSLFSSYVFFFFSGFSVRKFVILLMLNGVFFLPPNFVLSKVWRFLFFISNLKKFGYLYFYFFLKFWFMIPITLTWKCNLLLCITAMYQAYVAIHIHWPEHKS